jgi:ABC-type Mn2+/Zn2+ transport system permease subunit
VIHEFIHSWHLFGNAYLVGWLIGAMLSIVGVLVVARDQIFMGAALSQASTLAIAAAMWAGTIGPAWMQGDVFLSAVAVATSAGAAVLTSRGSGHRRESRESVTGWLFLLGASGSIVVVALSPHGLEEVRRLLDTSILGATRSEVGVFAVAAATTAVLIAIWRRALLLWVMDPATAAALGIRVGLMEVIGLAWLGLCVGMSIRVAGMLYTFGLLVLPALIAKSLVREVKSMFFVSPAVALIGSGIAFVVANQYELPTGQLTVALLAILLPVAWGVKRLRRA